MEKGDAKVSCVKTCTSFVRGNGVHARTDLNQNPANVHAVGRGNVVLATECNVIKHLAQTPQSVFESVALAWHNAHPLNLPNVLA